MTRWSELVQNKPVIIGMARAFFVNMKEEELNVRLILIYLSLCLSISWFWNDVLCSEVMFINRITRRRQPIEWLSDLRILNHSYCGIEPIKMETFESFPGCSEATNNLIFSHQN